MRTLYVKNKGTLTTIPITDNWHENFAGKYSFETSYGFVMEFNIAMSSELPDEDRMPFPNIFDNQGNMIDININPENDCLIAVNYVFNNTEIDFKNGMLPNDIKYIIGHVHNLLFKWYEKMGLNFNIFLLNCDQWECKGYFENI